MCTRQERDAEIELVIRRLEDEAVGSKKAVAAAEKAWQEKHARDPLRTWPILWCPHAVSIVCFCSLDEHVQRKLLRETVGVEHNFGVVCDV